MTLARCYKWWGSATQSLANSRTAQLDPSGCHAGPAGVILDPGNQRGCCPWYSKAFKPTCRTDQPEPVSLSADEADGGAAPEQMATILKRYYDPTRPKPVFVVVASTLSDEGEVQLSKVGAKVFSSLMQLAGARAERMSQAIDLGQR